MPELRWVLLILGIAFLAGLAWWELRRQRRLPGVPPEEQLPHYFREPSLGLPEIRPREPAAELPVVEIDESMIGLRVDGVRIEQDLQPAGSVSEHDEVPTTTAPTTPFEPQPPPEPIVQWPPEEQRRLVSLRLVAQPNARFAGRALRLALSAEGFVLGKFSIFHKAGSDARALVSAASLTQPGTFDVETMDTLRYGGLNLFAVLPGPLPDVQMFDALLKAARNLNARLDGVLQDERGAPLTAGEMAAICERLDSEAEQ